MPMEFFLCTLFLWHAEHSITFFFPLLSVLRFYYFTVKRPRCTWAKLFRHIAEVGKGTPKIISRLLNFFFFWLYIFFYHFEGVSVLWKRLDVTRFFEIYLLILFLKLPGCLYEGEGRRICALNTLLPKADHVLGKGQADIKSNFWKFEI